MKVCAFDAPPSGPKLAPTRFGLASALALVSACALVSGSEWESPIDRSHVLVGRIWDVEAGSFLDNEALVARLADREFILLGEKHDNADHHRLQAELVAALVGAGRRPAVAFEMFTMDDAPALAELRTRASVTPGDLREAVKWDEKGWPEWRIYAPIARAALAGQLTIAAANLSKDATSAVRSEGFEGLEAETLTRLALDRPFPPRHREAIAEQIRLSHCGYATEAMIPRQVDLQLARDAQMARVLLDASRAEDGAGAILIAGLEHARSDRAVPVHLARQGSEARLASVGFLEVSRDFSDPVQDLANRFGESIPFDFVWYTPGVDDSDPCEKFKELLEKMRSHPKGE